MFLKPFRVKTQNAIKGSDRKKLRVALGKRYSSLPPEMLTELVPNKEEMTVAKVHCHSGQDLLIYCLQKNPIFFDADGVVFPTVYLLWKFPDLLPVFTTWPPVLSKIQGGADLMLPGVVVQGEITPKCLGELKRGEVCSVNLLGNRAPVAVGRTALSTKDMVLDAGMKGKGVIISHCFGDHLWMFGDKSEPPMLEDPNAHLVDEEGEGEKGSEEEAEKTSSPPEAAEGATDDMTAVEGRAGVENEGQLEAEVAAVSLEKKENGEEEGDKVEDDDELSNISPQEQMDELVLWCFYCAIKVNIKKSDLPILTSNFYRNHMLPCCPKNKTIDIKKSSYKKLSKFLAAMKKSGFITLKQQKDVESITEIHKDHPDLRGIDVSDVEIAAPAGAKSEDADSAPVFKPPVISEVYLVTGNIQQLFKPAGISKGTALSATEVRKFLVDYAKENELLSKTAKGFVILDPILTSTLLNKSEYIESLRYDDLTTRCLSKMTLAHHMVLNGQPPILKKGKLEPVKIDVATRMGNKKVTLVENLEIYGIDPQELAHTVQVGMACSTTVHPQAGKNAASQVIIQGNQIRYLADLLLEKYKLQRKWIAGLEKAPKGKRR